MFKNLLAALGSFLLGYNTAIIAGALPFIRQTFHLSTTYEGFVVSSVLIGALLGALFAGKVADHFGRRPATFITAALFILGIAIASLAHSIEFLIIGRFITGIGAGLTSVIAPLYLAEVAPIERRGAIVGINQLAITVGVLIAYSMNYVFASTGNWQWMFALGMIPALLQLSCFAWLPETSAWIGKPKIKIHWHAIFQPRYRKLLLLGLFLSSCQQITGINAIVYFAPEIFRQAGFSSISVSILATLGLGFVSVIVTPVCMRLIDNVGRKRLLLVGVAGMAVSLLVLASAFYTKTASLNIIALACLTAYMAFFAIGLGPVTWVFLSEIYPLEVRGAAMSLAIFANWLSNTIVAFTFLDLMILMGSGGAFCLYAIIGIISWFILYRFLPETKGKSL